MKMTIMPSGDVYCITPKDERIEALASLGASQEVRRVSDIVFDPSTKRFRVKLRDGETLEPLYTTYNHAVQGEVAHLEARQLEESAYLQKLFAQS